MECIRGHVHFELNINWACRIRKGDFNVKKQLLWHTYLSCKSFVIFKLLSKKSFSTGPEPQGSRQGWSDSHHHIHYERVNRLWTSFYQSVFVNILLNVYTVQNNLWMLFAFNLSQHKIINTINILVKLTTSLINVGYYVYLSWNDKVRMRKPFV